MSRSVTLAYDAMSPVALEPSSLTAALPKYVEDALYTQAPNVVFRTLRALDWAFAGVATGFLTHRLHPYPAKFIPQLAGRLIARLSARGELVLDPFGGSGTTALEALRLGRRAVSADANPLAALLGRVKTTWLEPEDTIALQALAAGLGSQVREGALVTASLLERYGASGPAITHREKWFGDAAYAELAHIRARIAGLPTSSAQDVANVALSRAVLPASFQDSETRYKSVLRLVAEGDTTRLYLRELACVMRIVEGNTSLSWRDSARFLTTDTRDSVNLGLGSESVDCVVTSPPYGNATDYHLYHRFRLLWLGFDPIAFAHMEIGSHLRQQREASGFDAYFGDLRTSVVALERLLKPGRYMAMVLGDCVYAGTTYSPAQSLAGAAAELGFDAVELIPRALPQTRRSFTPAGRRATGETVLLMRKRARKLSVCFEPPPYKPWPYEKVLRQRELAQIAGRRVRQAPGSVAARLDPSALQRAKGLAFTHNMRFAGGHHELTWQAALENGSAVAEHARKDPKYATHGLHAYKGKFYPQLAKGLINQSGLAPGATVLDPFCGSGTTVLEGYLNGFRAFGCDLNPLAAQIALAKTSILEVDYGTVQTVTRGLMATMHRAPTTPPRAFTQFGDESRAEILRWFAPPVAYKLDWLLARIREQCDGTLRQFTEVVLSSIVREVSQQEPSDLRIRLRQMQLADADVFGLFTQRLRMQVERIRRFWEVRSYAPNPFHATAVACADNQLSATYDQLGLAPHSVDMVLTSPPYAMALPYIDTDRLSLLILFGLTSAQRRPLEQTITGSREINAGERVALETELAAAGALPDSALTFLRKLQARLQRAPTAGFRKRNMPALLFRFLCQMNASFDAISTVLKPGGDVMIVIGDSRMTIAGDDVRIPTTDLVEALANAHRLHLVERLDISVTRENLVHIKHAITRNVVLHLRQSRGVR